MYDAGHDPDEVLVNESFYNDIIKYGGKVGPTECTAAVWVPFLHPE